MKSKEFFRQVLKAEKELKILKAKIRHFEDLGLTITSNTSAVGGHQQGASRVELAAIGKVDATADLNKELRQYMALIARAEQVIRDIPQERYQQILNYRYLCGWSLRSISDELGYNDPNSIYRAHGWALTEAQKILNKMKENGHEKDLQ